MNRIAASALGVNEAHPERAFVRALPKSRRGSFQLADMRFARETVDNQSN